MVNKNIYVYKKLKTGNQLTIDYIMNIAKK